MVRTIIIQYAEKQSSNKHIIPTTAKAILKYIPYTKSTIRTKIVHNLLFFLYINPFWERNWDAWMKYENKKDKTLETIEVFEDAIVIFNDGTKQLFDVIHITDKEVVVGRILNHEVFVKCGGISRENIRHIRHDTKKKYRKRKHKIF